MIPTPNMENPGAPAKFYSRSPMGGHGPKLGRSRACGGSASGEGTAHLPFNRLVSAANDSEEALGD